MESTQELVEAIRRYFDLMYDCNTDRFLDVFAPTAQLHGFRSGEMVSWSADQYREVLRDRVPPAARNSPRQDRILLMDLASDTHAVAKVEVRLHDSVYQDYLTFHRIEGSWLITSKGYHLMCTV